MSRIDMTRVGKEAEEKAEKNRKLQEDLVEKLGINDLIAGIRSA